MIDIKALKTGDIIWVESNGAVTRCEVEVKGDISSWTWRWGYIHLYALPKRKFFSADLYSAYYTRKEAITAAQQWLNGKIAIVQAREARLKKGLEKINPQASQWLHPSKGSWHRKDFSLNALASVNAKGAWRIPRLLVKGQAATPEEARDAVDKILLDWGWELDQW